MTHDVPDKNRDQKPASGWQVFRKASFSWLITGALSGLLLISSVFAVQNNNDTMNLPELFSKPADQFIIIAHRGASYNYPENTMIAFEKALEMGADMIELDVTLSSDGIPVVFHDVQLDEKTDGTGMVGDYTLGQLRELDAGSWFSQHFAGEPIPTLDEVLAWAAGKITLNIEIKSEAVSQSAGGIEEKVIDLVYRYGMEKHVLISSFSYTALARLDHLDPAIPTGLLYNDNLTNPTSAKKLVESYNVASFHCHWRELSRGWRSELQAAGIPVFVYTVNTRGRMRRLIRRGVTGIFTDRPDLLKEVAAGVAGTDQELNR